MFVLVFAFLASFAGVAMAQGAVNGDPPPGLYEFAKPVINAIFTGQPGLAAALALVLVAGVINRYAGGRWAIFNASWARAATVLVGSFGGAAAVAIGGGAAWSLALCWSALKVAAGAAGVFGLAKALALPVIKSLRGKLPSWLRPIFDIVIAVFEKPDPIASAVLEGDRAVAAHPSPGIAGVVGEPIEVDADIEPNGPTVLPAVTVSAPLKVWDGHESTRAALASLAGEGGASEAMATELK
jgi:hypothetical protein